MSCPAGCPIEHDCRYAASCGIPPWHPLAVGALTERHLGFYVRLPIAGRNPAYGALTGLWPFAEGMTVLRLQSATDPAAVHLVADTVEIDLR